MEQRQYNNIATIQVREEKWVDYFLPFNDFSVSLFPLVEIEAVCVMVAIPPKKILRKFFIIDASLLAGQNRHFQTVKTNN